MSTVSPPFLDRSPEHPIQAQELFDWAARTLHAMPRRAMEGNTCRYRTGNPQVPACIAGQLMTDDEIQISPEDQARDFAAQFQMESPYKPFENAATFDKTYAPGFDSIVIAGLAPARLAPHKNLISALQQCHDINQNWSDDRRGMREDLLDIATRHGLDKRVVHELWATA